MPSPSRGCRMRLLGWCCGRRAEPPRSTSSPLGRGWDGVGGCQGNEKLRMWDPTCSLLQQCLLEMGWDGMGRDRKGWDWVGWDGVLSCSIVFPAGSSQAWLWEDGAGWINPWGKAGSSEQLWVSPLRLQLQPYQARCVPPSNGARPSLWGPASSAPQIQERSRVSRLFLDPWVTQHPPHWLAWHMVPQSLRDLSSLPGPARDRAMPLHS